MATDTLSTTVPLPCGPTLAAVHDGLSAQGFGVLTEIDLAATLREKLGVEVPPQVILGACRPPLAHQALTAEPLIATVLPCNVVVRHDGPERSQVEVLDPSW